MVTISKHLRPRNFAGKLVALASFVLLAGCAPDLPIEPPPETVYPIWDPATSTLPTPTNLVRDEATGRLDLPIDSTMPRAEQQFRAYLNSLDGYPLSSTIAIPMSAPVDPNRLDGLVLMQDLDANERVEISVTWDETSNTIFASPTGGDLLEPGRNYAYGVWGYDNGTSGPTIVADAAFYLLRTERPLTEHLSAVPGSTTEEKLQTAETLEALKPQYADYVDALAQRGVQRDQLAVVAGFTTTSQPTFWFDPGQGEIPIPNNILIDPDTGLVSLPEDPDDDEEARDLKETISTYQGFSTTGTIRIKATDPVRPSSVTPQTFRLFRVVDGEVAEVIDVERGIFEDGRTITMTPNLALEPSSDYVYVVTNGVETGTGTPIGAQPITALLRSDAQLVDADGKSQVSSLDAATATRLESARLDASPVVDYLVANEGLERSDISAVVPFRTIRSLRRLLDVRADLYERDVPTDVRNVIERTPNERGLGFLLSVETIVTGQMVTWDRLDARTRRFYPDGRGEERLIDFVLTVPEGYDPGEPIPVVLFGHGLYTSRELVYLIANRLARDGYASFSIDLPYHGKRTVCTQDTDCFETDTCDELGRCQGPDGMVTEHPTVSSPFPDGPEYPSVSGVAFVEPDNIIGSRDHFQQAVADLLQALRVVRGADWASASGGWVLDGDDVVYLGMSLGGILGSNLAAVEPTIETFVLNVPGADYYDILSNSETFQTIFQRTLDRRGVERGSDEYIEFQSGVRWLLDPVDPINTVQHAVRSPFIWTDPVTGEEAQSPVKRVMIQMAEGDIVVPNLSTRNLSERSGVPIRTYTPAVSNHAFFFDPTSLEGGRARNDAVEWFNDR